MRKRLRDGLPDTGASATGDLTFSDRGIQGKTISCQGGFGRSLCRVRKERSYVPYLQVTRLCYDLLILEVFNPFRPTRRTGWSYGDRILFLSSGTLADGYATVAVMGRRH